MTYDFSRAEQRIIKAAWATDPGRAALTLVIERLGMLHMSSFSPDSHLTAFNEGRRFVAVSIAAAINQPLKDEDAGSTTDKRAVVTATERAANVATKHTVRRRKP